MNIYLSYKQSGIDKIILENELWYIKKQLEKLGHKVFVYYFDEDSSFPAFDLDKRFLENIKNSDLVLAYINYKDKSEGQLLELGMSYALNKKIKIILNKNVKDNYFLVYGLWEVFKFDVLEKVEFNTIIIDN